MQGLKIGMINTASEWEAAKLIREKVFQQEQNVIKELDLDGKDKESSQFIAYYEDVACGTCRLRFLSGMLVKLERLAVLKEKRGKGIAKSIVSYAINFAKMIGANQIYCNAQLQAKGLYESLGFQEEGDLFMEADIKHIKMRKEI